VMGADDNKPKSLPYKNGCPDGYHKRESFLSVLGHRIGTRCVRSTTVYKNTSKQHKEKTLARMTRRLKGVHIPRISSLQRRGKCPPGQIERKGYVRKFSTAVRERGYTVRRASGTTYRVHPKASTAVVVGSKCVENKGRPGKGPQAFGPLRKGELAKHGYAFRKAERERHGALRRAIGEFGALGVYRKLDAVAKLMERSAPEAATVFRKDRDWVKSHFSIKAF
jgi:hypothetical protein